MSDCEKNLELIQMKLDGTLSVQDERALSGHLEKCGPCRGKAELLRSADALLLAAGAPKIEEAEWVERTQILNTLASGAREFPLKPPDVKDEEWERVWDDIERHILLDGVGRESGGAILPAARKRVLTRRILTSFTTLAAAVLIILAAYLFFSPTEIIEPPLSENDTVTVARGYYSSTVKIESAHPVHIIAMEEDVLDTIEIDTAEGFLHSVGKMQDSGDVVEIIAEGELEENEVESTPDTPVIVPPMGDTEDE